MPVTARGAGGTTGWKRASAWSSGAPSPVRKQIYIVTTRSMKSGETPVLTVDMSLEGLHVLHSRQTAWVSQEENAEARLKGGVNRNLSEFQHMQRPMKHYPK